MATTSERHKEVTMLVPGFRSSPSPGRDTLVVVLEHHLPGARVESECSAMGTGPLLVHVAGASVVEVYAAGQLYLGWIGVRFALTRRDRAPALLRGGDAGARG